MHPPDQYFGQLLCILFEVFAFSVIQRPTESFTFFTEDHLMSPVSSRDRRLHPSRPASDHHHLFLSATYLNKPALILPAYDRVNNTPGDALCVFHIWGKVLADAIITADARRNVFRVPFSCLLW